jgi:hypothetical protein
VSASKVLPRRARAAGLALATLLGSPLVARAGTGPASLACSGPGLTLKGLIPATEAALNLTLTEGSHQVVMLAEQGDTVQVIEAFDDRVFTLTVTRKAAGAPLRLYARPGSIKLRKETHGQYARFQAVLLEAPKPGPAGTPPAVLRGVKLACQYDYEI